MCVCVGGSYRACRQEPWPVNYIRGSESECGGSTKAYLEVGSLARPSESLDIQCRRLDLAVCWHAFVLSPIEEVLAFVADKGPLCKSAAGICARCYGSADGACTTDRLDIDVL